MRAKFINEAKINPDKELFEEFKRIVLEVKDSNTHDPFYELNQRLNSLNIYLVDYDSHFESLPKEEKTQFMKANMIPELGIRILGFDPPSNQIFMVVDKSFDDKFERMPRNRLMSILERLWSGFGHETIHVGQVGKMKVQQDPKFKSEDEYFSNKQEIMAMAFSFVEEMRDFHSDEEIIDLLRTGTVQPPPGMPRMPAGFRPPPGMPPPPPPGHPLYNIYKELGGKSFKLFAKYAYQYLTED